MKSKYFNNNSNKDLFEKLKEIKEVEKEIALKSDSIVNKSLREKQAEKEKESFNKLLEKKYDEYLVGKAKPYTRKEQKIIEEEILKYEVEKNITLDRLDIAEDAILETMEKRGLHFSLPIIKNRKLKRAAKRFFKEKKQEITFEDYNKALKRIKELQKKESKGLMSKRED